MRDDLPTGTVTFLFTDVEGSTKLLHELGEEAYAKALAEHRRVIREACASHGGIEVDTQGDAFFFSFPTAPGALAAARTFSERLEAAPIQVRVGLHTGTPLVGDEGYFGEDVHVAARVAASGHGGQVILSWATASLVEVPLTDLGEHRLKDVADAVAIFQLGEKRFPPLKTVSNTNLPRPASSFLGRETELAEIISRIESGARLLSLTGPGGTGKTRLALEAAATLIPAYKSGVFWVELASLRDSELVTETVAQTLGTKDDLAEHIGEREMLLLLDNLEQVIECAPELATLLEACPSLTLLATSRELLRVRGEVEYQVPPLAASEAVSLFCERAQLEPSEEIVELCARLDLLPLAIELAAARTKALSPAQILERLSSRLDLLKGGRDADPRQQTLRATIEWSYDLLSPAEQELCWQLSVFAGGCTLHAAQEVCDAEVNTLQSLVEKSLLRFYEERFSMLETIREFATERLEQSGDASVLRERHATYFFALSVEGPRDRATRQSLNFLRAELENFRAALYWLRQSSDQEREAELAVSLYNLWIMAGYSGEGRMVVHKALRDIPPSERRAYALHTAGDLALEEGDYVAAKEFLAEALGLYRTLGVPQSVALCLCDLAHVAKCLREYEHADALFRESLQQSRGNDDLDALASVLLNYADLLVASGEFARAEATCLESMAIYRELESALGVATCGFTLGHAVLRQNRHQEASELLVGCLSTMLELEYDVGIACSLEGLAHIAAGYGKTDDAARLLGAAEALMANAGAVLEPGEQALHEETVEALRTAMGELRLAELSAVGRAMERDELAELAISAVS